MISFLLWYLAASLIGLIALPLAYRLLPALPDRGYAFMRPLGILLWGYLFWLLGSLHILGNDLGGELIALGIVAGLSIWSLRSTGWGEFLAWLRAKGKMIIIVEVLFAAAFALWALMRAASPDIFGTEKPMELAFIQSVLRSPALPPADPWLSGYAISYYHFGYILVAMLARLTGTPAPVAFNLGISLVFALTAVGAYGLLYNLLRTREKPLLSASTPLLGPLFLLISSNVEGFLEFLHARHFFWTDGQSPFWQWLGISDLNTPPAAEPSFLVRDFGTGAWWWWRASRVIMDYRADGSFTGDVINEFPYFSFLLADLHPHVLAMPFLLLAFALALNVFRGGAAGELDLKFARIPLNLPSFLLAGVVLGGLGFLNTWDFPLAVGLLAAAFALARYLTSAPDLRSTWRSLVEFIGMALLMLALGGLLYLPFYLGFSSQAGGPIPNLVYQTRGAQFWVMFAPLMIPLFMAFTYWLVKERRGSHAGKGFAWAAGIVAALCAVSLLLVVLIRYVLPSLGAVNPLAPSAGTILLDTFHAESWDQLMAVSWQRRFAHIGALITMFALMGLALAMFLARPRTPVTTPAVDRPADAADLEGTAPGPANFVAVMVAIGCLLVTALEFVYLRDQFGYRINSVFKFYFQTWILWSLAAAYAFALLWKEIRGLAGVAVKVVLAAVLAVSLFYPLYGFADRFGSIHALSDLTLDGSDYMNASALEELEAIRWLQSAPYGTIVEAVSPSGGSYTDYARLSEFSGNPTVLGWIGHESQWRGGGDEMGSRQADVDLLYTTRNWEEARRVIDRYGIRYIVIGSRERFTYPNLYETKFQQFLTPVYEYGSMTIYAAP